MPIPKSVSRKITKASLLEKLRFIDSDDASRNRVLQLDTHFQHKIRAHTCGLTLGDSLLGKFNTNPFVLLIHASSRGYSRVDQIERDILPAKQFSSMETSAGRMVEEVVLPVYGWECVASAMHTANSALDGRKVGEDSYEVVTLKSGPRCLNDEMSENFADAIIQNATSWSESAATPRVSFTYGVLYGTEKRSNKKDWHILRKLAEKCATSSTCQVITHPDNRWNCTVTIDGTPVEATVRIGTDWWTHLGGDNCLIEVLVAMIRACITTATEDENTIDMMISDLPLLISTATVPADYNVALLQRRQLPWLFLMAAHFCDELL